MAKQYKLELIRGYPQDTHHRAGLVLQRGGALVTELTKDQLEAVKNDHYISLSEAKDGEQSKASPVSQGSEGAGVADTDEVGPDAPDRTASEDTEVVEDQPAESEEAADGEAEGTEGSVAEDASEDAAEGEAEDAADEAAESEEAQETVENTSSEAVETAADLARDNDRPTLNKMAAELGVVDADKLQNKVEVATAIIEKRG